MDTWLCDAKFKVGMNNFPIDIVFFGGPGLVHFARILCIQFAQIHNNIFHASLFDAMCGRYNEVPRH